MKPYIPEIPLKDVLAFGKKFKPSLTSVKI
jgi:hypothetical protein